MERIEDLIKELEACSFVVKEYTQRKKILEEKIMHQCKHVISGQKTYHFNNAKITIKTGYNCLVDKDVYLDLKKSGFELFSPTNPFNFIKEKMSYEVNMPKFKMHQQFLLNHYPVLNELLILKEKTPQVSVTTLGSTRNL